MKADKANGGPPVPLRRSAADSGQQLEVCCVGGNERGGTPRSFTSTSLCGVLAHLRSKSLPCRGRRTPMTAAPLRLLIDTDPGVDDALALLMALRYPGARVEALTVVAGNVGLEHCVRNARWIAEWCEADVPIYAGAPRALLRNLERA